MNIAATYRKYIGLCLPIYQVRHYDYIYYVYIYIYEYTGNVCDFLRQIENFL